MAFLTGLSLSDATHRLLREDDLRLAIAFWGHGAEDRLVGNNARVVCNLASGGTNPRALERLIEKNILQAGFLRQCDTLHAKVYIGSNRSIISSANLSSNGLGLEGVEQSFWDEAGVEVETSAEIGDWFEALWRRSRAISEHDFEQAKAKWRSRQNVKPSRTIPTYDIANERLPFLLRVYDQDWSIESDTVKKKLGYFNEIVARRIDEGVTIFQKSDLDYLRDRWIVTWLLDNGQIKEFAWIRTSNNFLPKSFKVAGADNPEDTLLGAETPLPPPFDLTAKGFKESLAATIRLPRFAIFREDHSGNYYSKQDALLAPFWAEVQQRYDFARSTSQDL